MKFDNETVWLTQIQLVELYQSSKSNISEHLTKIFNEGELDEISVVQNFRTTASDGKIYNVNHYSLDMIISLGYRIREIRAMKQSPMYMADYIKQLDTILSATGEKLLQNAGAVSHDQAKKKAIEEYHRYHVKTISPVEQAYLDSIKELSKNLKNNYQP